jgi:hypothetical protein
MRRSLRLLLPLLAALAGSAPSPVPPRKTSAALDARLREAQAG